MAAKSSGTECNESNKDFKIWGFRINVNKTKIMLYKRRWQRNKEGK
jgi:hypothetical protein